MDTPTFSLPGVNGSPVFQRMVHDPSVRLEMSHRAQNVEVLIQHVILDEQPEGRMEDLRLSEQRYQDSASSQHELPMRAEASIQCSEGQLDQARRQIFQDEVILSHVMESEYLAFAEAYQQYMHAEISSRGLTHAWGVAEDLPRRLQRTEVGAGARVTHLERRADRLYSEECEFSQRRLREEHEIQARQEVHQLELVWPHIMATEQQLEAECQDLWSRMVEQDQEMRTMRIWLGSESDGANIAASEMGSGELSLSRKEFGRLKKGFEGQSSDYEHALRSSWMLELRGELSRKWRPTPGQRPDVVRREWSI